MKNNCGEAKVQRRLLLGDDHYSATGDGLENTRVDFITRWKLRPSSAFGRLLEAIKLFS
jgi:hypothetical protein